jgi:hypothetical protein
VVAPGRVPVPGRGTPSFTSPGAVSGCRASYKPRPLFPDPVLPGDTGMLTEPRALTEISEPPEQELALELLVLPAEVEVLLLPEPVLSTETGALTEPGAVTETSEPPLLLAGWILPLNTHSCEASVSSSPSLHHLWRCLGAASSCAACFGGGTPGARWSASVPTVRPVPSGRTDPFTRYLRTARSRSRSGHRVSPKRRQGKPMDSQC